MHPALSRFLRLKVLQESPEQSRDAWCGEFVAVMGGVADHYTPKQQHEQRGVFHIHGANFQSALAEAVELSSHTGGEELIAAEVRGALVELGRVVGTVYTDDVLDRIFSQFCIGK